MSLSYVFPQLGFATTLRARSCLRAFRNGDLDSAVDRTFIPETL